MQTLKILSACVAATLALHAQADVSTASACYETTPSAANKSAPFLFFQSYYDNDLLENVGAFVTYNNSKARLPLIFSDEVQGTGPNDGDYQRYWLEVIGKKVTGQYVQYGNYRGNPGGRYIRYTNFKSGRIYLFRLSTTESPCAPRS